MSNYAKESGHWYKTDGTPFYQIEKADGSGLRNTTLRDAKKLNLLPSVTTILNILNKPALNQWLVRNAIEAALTTPRNAGETVDAFAERILNVDADSISDAAKQRGTDIHALIEKSLSGMAIDIMHPLAEFVFLALKEVHKFGTVMAVEKTVVGSGYAGKLDCAFHDGNRITVVDFKTTKSIPKAQYDEHRLQLAAYAKTFGQGEIQTANIYIDSVTPGKLLTFIDTDWSSAYEDGFLPILKHWQWAKDYKPATI